MLLIFFSSLSPTQEISQALKFAPYRYYALVKIIVQTTFALQKCTKFRAHLRGANPEDHNLKEKKLRETACVFGLEHPVKLRNVSFVP